MIDGINWHTESIPNEWSLQPLSSVSLLITKGATPTTYGFKFVDEGVRFIRGENLSDTGRYAGNDRHISNAADNFLQRSKVSEDDIILGIVGTLGKHLLVKKNYLPANISQNVALIRCLHQECNPAFMSFYLQSHWFEWQIKSEVTVQAQPSVNLGQVGEFIIPLPPLPQQKKIARILTTVDNLIEKTEALIEKYKAIKQGMMHDLFTRGVDKNGKLRPPYEEAPHLYKDSLLGWIPKEWEARKLVDLTEKIVDGVHHTPTYVEGGVPFVTVKNLTKGAGIDFSDINYISEKDHVEFIRRADPKTGDVIVSKDGTLGVARIVYDEYPVFSIFVSVAIVRPNRELCAPHFIWAFFDSGVFETQLGRLSSGTGLKHIHLEHFREFVLATPPLSEQEQILIRVESIEEMLKSESSHLNTLQKLKTGIMQDLLTGNVRVKVDEVEEELANA